MPADAPAHVFAVVHNCNPEFVCGQMQAPLFRTHHASEAHYPVFLIYASVY